ncbi:hypothetical protein GWI33_011160 [Rhynchophorus ferrugineus]|uniref:Uncharacterized protein n=1 Tax=Rhynchophorus ferrugineus TaxID=354439 RepID=A0A834I7H4_RHYFE|nr:hypothetical protein GWI33_011160 [Rhynchophorus ferrugineus]
MTTGTTASNTTKRKNSLKKRGDRYSRSAANPKTANTVVRLSINLNFLAANNRQPAKKIERNDNRSVNRSANTKKGIPSARTRVLETGGSSEQGLRSIQT